MQKRLISGFIVIFLALAVQDGFFGTNEANFPDVPKSSALTIGTVANSTPYGGTRIVRIVDGDTVVVNIKGIQEKVRLIGVDTPETVDPRGSVQCFGEEASAFTKSILENQTVRLEADPTQDDRDRYGRLLRYVFLNDTLVNKELISLGYGHEYTYRRPYKYQREFKNAERSARESQKGLWAQSVCKD